MYLDEEHHVSRHVPYKKLIRDESDEPVGVLPQAFEMRQKLGEKALSVNWLEYFDSHHDDNIVRMVKSFRKSREDKGQKVGVNSAFGIGNVGELIEKCKGLKAKKAKVLFNDKRKKGESESHATIIRLPINDEAIMHSLASEVFTELVKNKDINDI